MFGHKHAIKNNTHTHTIVYTIPLHPETVFTFSIQEAHRSPKAVSTAQHGHLLPDELGEAQKMSLSYK